MSIGTWTARHEAAISIFEKHIVRTETGTLRLTETDHTKLGVDEDIFEELRLSMEITNDLIETGALNPDQIVLPTA